MSNFDEKLDEIAAHIVAKGVDASHYLMEDPKRFNEIFGEGVKYARAAIKQLTTQQIEKAVAEARGETNIFDTWLSIPMGAEVRFEPIGMWGQRVWQNGATYVCSGIKKNDGSESITDHYDYRFTQIGDSSVGDEYSDIFLTGKQIKNWFNEGAKGDIRTLSGWFSFAQLQKGDK